MNFFNLKGWKEIYYVYEIKQYLILILTSIVIIYS